MIDITELVTEPHGAKPITVDHSMDNGNHITGITAWMLTSAVISRLSEVMEDDQISQKLRTVTGGS